MRNQVLAVAAALSCLVASVEAQVVQLEQQRIGALPAGSFDGAGRSVAVGSDVAAIGVPDDDSAISGSGSVSIYRRVGTEWFFEDRLQPSFPTTGYAFGESIALSGDTLLVGSPFDLESGLSAGAVHVYVFDGTTWVEEEVLTASDAQAGDQFGRAVALSGDRALVGAPADDDLGTSSGSAYVFDRTGTQWSEEAKLLPIDGVTSDEFGSVLSVDGGLCVVGARLDDPSGQDSGSAYVFRRVAASWVEMQKLVPSDGAQGDQFGTGVAIDSLRVAVGSPNDDGPSNSGSVYVFELQGLTWVESQKVRANDPSGQARFGASVDLDGSVLVVGTPLGDAHSLNGNTGCAYAFEDSSGTWLQQSKLVGSDSLSGDEMGSSICTDGTVTIVGSPLFGSNERGAAHVFYASDDVLLYCFGDGGDQMGCTDCPCSNNAPVGSIGGCQNSSGGSARLRAFGRPSIQDDTLSFFVRSATTSTFAVLVSGANQLPLAGSVCPSGSGLLVPAAPLDGLRCIGAMQLRHGTRGTDTSGSNVVAWGPPGGPAGGIIASGGFTFGQVRYFQAFYREFDTLGCMNSVGTSNGVAVVIQP